MNYITLNGIKSNTIQGLLIQELPPISKPLMRTEIIEIDGKPGDIVNELGYSAYDKEITIGLHGKYNIDNVINYFSGSGEVIFSNEPEKKYTYRIIEQIDYERLLRYRTATVTFHVQPFKLSAVQSALQFNILNNIRFNSFQDTQSGITVQIIDGGLTVTGTAGANVSINVPVSVTLPEGNYTLDAVTLGTTGGATVTLTNGVTAFEPIALDNSQTVSASKELGAETTFTLVVVDVPSGASVELSTELAVYYDDITSVGVDNVGNTTAKPVITVAGSGDINLYLNGSQVFVINAGEGISLTIDCAEMEAYSGNVLMNRYVTGNFDNFSLPIGYNEISWNGYVTAFGIKHYSRWI